MIITTVGSSRLLLKFGNHSVRQDAHQIQRARCCSRFSHHRNAVRKGRYTVDIIITIVAVLNMMMVGMFRRKRRQAAALGLRRGQILQRLRHVQSQRGEIGRAFTVHHCGLRGALQDAAVAAAVHPHVVTVQQFLPHGILPGNVGGTSDLEQEGYQRVGSVQVDGSLCMYVCRWRREDS